MRVAALLVLASLLVGCEIDRRSSWSAFDQRPAVNGLIDGWHAAAASGDFEGYFGRMTADAVFLGTDASERWEREDFESFARPYFDGVEAWTYRPRDRFLAFDGDGRTGWFDELLDHARYGELRGTGVVRRGSDGRWRMAHYSLTFTVPNEAAPRVVEIIRPILSEGDR
ncbi:MAG: nuclear transport factor 2 family protein [Planctomycetota bacterium]